MFFLVRINIANSPSVAFVIAGCASVGSDFDMSQFSRFKEGVTTKNEIVSAVGKPTGQSSLGNDQTSLSWQFVTKTLGSSVKSKTATAIFDKEDRLVRVVTSESSY